MKITHKKRSPTFRYLFLENAVKLDWGDTDHQ